MNELQRLTQLKALRSRIDAGIIGDIETGDLRARIDTEITTIEASLRERFPRPDCGTEPGYQWHKHRREFNCEPCRKAHNADQRERYWRRKDTA